MKLSQLEPEFIQLRNGGRIWHPTDMSLADGIMFLCPKCFMENSGPIGTHRIVCWRPHVPLEIKPGPGRWEMQGSGVHDVSLVAGASSVKITEGCKAHFFLQNGEIRMC